LEIGGSSVSDPARSGPIKLQVNKKKKVYKSGDGIIRSMDVNGTNTFRGIMSGALLGGSTIEECSQYNDQKQAYALMTLASNQAGPSTSQSYTASSFR
jgi:hypothetical protein